MVRARPIRHTDHVQSIERRRAVIVLGLLLIGSACSEPACDTGSTPDRATVAPLARRAPPPGAENVILIIADDVGNDKIGAYGEHRDAPPTPNVDRLARDGVLFRNAYSYATCSPARAAMLTGRFGRRYGLGKFISVRSDRYELPIAALTIPEMLALSDFDYDHSAVGKWHLASRHTGSDNKHPLVSGFRWHAGSFGNVGQYTRWEKLVDGKATTSHRYATTDTIDDAISRVDTMHEPFFMWVALNAVHRPLHIPPTHLHSSRPGLERTGPVPEVHDAMVEAMDTEIGRLLDAIPPDVRERTTIIFLGDNGTYKKAILPPLSQEHSKGTLWEGGVNVPFIVTGPAVSRRGSESAALVHVVDVFATVADIAGVPLAALTNPNGAPLVIDGKSLMPHVRDPNAKSSRRYLYTERFAGFGPPPYEDDGRMVRDARYKLVRFAEGHEGFFDLANRTDDGPNLLDARLTPAQRAEYDRLSAELDQKESQLKYDGY